MENESTCPLVKGQNILVALDGSATSDQALEQAISLGKQCNSQIYALSIIELYPEQMEMAPELEDKLGQRARDIVAKAKKRVESENISCEAIVATDGQPHDTIIEVARKNEVDLIVMGSHGRTGLKKLLMGSVAAKVIGYAPCAVMVIPNL